ncbi:sensor histidine kinase [Paenibacillus cremeus]|nr:sensor histidine kinase [Paenibacillus cremeus]
MFIPRLSLRNKIMIIFLLLIAFPLTIQGMITYYDYSSSLERRTADYTVQIADQVNRNLDRTLIELQRLSLMPLYDQQLLAILRQYSQPGLRQQRPTLEEMEKMSQYISGAAYNRPEVKGIQFITGSGYIFSNVDPNLISFYIDPQKESWYPRVKEADGAFVVIPTHAPSYYFTDGQSYFSVARLIREPNTNNVLGMMKIDLKLDVFRQILANLKFADEGSFMVVNGSNEPFFEESKNIFTDTVELVHSGRFPNETRSDTIEIKGKKVLAVVDYSAYSGLKVISLIPIEALLKETIRLRNFTMGLAGVCLISGGLLAIYFSFRITEPLLKLKQKMFRVEQGHFNESVPVLSFDEIGQLGKGFNRMVEEINRLVNEVYVIGLREKEAELAALQSQINPHFIYNTLESINMMAVRGRNAEASEMVTALGKLLRYTVDKYDRCVSLEEELNATASYVKILQVRYGERLEVIFDVEEGLQQAAVPRLIFQPLVENAIYHGIGDCEEGGTVWITAARFENDLLLSVRDNGRGLTERELERIQQSLQEPDYPSWESGGRRRGGLALRNISQRIILMFGQTYELHIDGSPGEGTAVTLTIPISLEG